MNVLLVVPWDEARGGVISVVQNVARHLQQAGHGVLLCHPGGFRLQRTVTKIGFEGVRLRLSLPTGRGLRGALQMLVFPFVFVSSLLQLLWLLRSRRIGIVNLHYPYDNCVYFAVCRRLLSTIRLVTSVHGRDAFYQERPKTDYSRAFRSIIRASDLIVLPSEAYRRKLLEAFPQAEDRTVSIHNGVDPGQFTPVDPARRGNGLRYFLCVAELQEYKAVDVLLQAAAPLLRDDPSLTVVLAGDGPLRAELQALSSSLGIRHQTMFLGTQGASEIARLMQGCRAMVLPSRMEPFGIVLIEAMACKAPVVASDVGGIPEIVQHDISGILVEPENPKALSDALRRVLTDDRLARSIAENGYARVMERFCAGHHGAMYLSAYASLVHAGPSPTTTPATRSATQ